MGFVPTRKEARYIHGLLARGEYNTISAVLHDAVAALREKRKGSTFAPRPAMVEVAVMGGNGDEKT